MKIGTHNSLSYLPPLKWWMRLFTITAKCQRLTIEEQYNKGVRYFDIRFKFHNDRLYSGHGFTLYEVDFDKLFQSLNKKGDCIVRLMLENTKVNLVDEQRFVDVVYDLLNKYPNIQFTHGYRKQPFEPLIKLPEVDIQHCYPFFSWRKLPFPCLYKPIPANDTDNYKLYDFIEKLIP